MKKKILICAIIILLSTLSIFLFINININKNIKTNRKVLDILNDIFEDNKLETTNEFKNNLPKLQVDGTDYVGIINIPKHNLLLPVESKCNNSIINIQSTCKYLSNSLIILGTNLNDSFSSFRLYNVKDTVSFTNMLGETYQYKIKNIKRVKDLKNISRYDEDLIIIIKNYYDMEYILFICNSY